MQPKKKLGAVLLSIVLAALPGLAHIGRPRTFDGMMGMRRPGDLSHDRRSLLFCHESANRYPGAATTPKQP